MSKRNRWFQRKKTQALYTRVEPMAESSDMLDCARAALKAGAKEIHLGWLNCALCGEELGEAVENEILNDAGAGSPRLEIHLCDRCWYRYKGVSKRN